MLERFQMKDASGGELIFWLIIGALWVVGQFMTKLKERRARQAAASQPRPTAPPAPETREEKERGGDFEEHMKRFIEAISGETLEEEPAPPPPPPPRPRPAPVQYRERPTPPPRPRPAPILPDRGTGDLGAIVDAIDAHDAYTNRVYDISSIQDRLGTSSLVDPRTFLVNLTGLHMDLVSVPVPMMSTTAETIQRPSLKNRADLRQALIGQFILSPPLAMGEDKASFTKRAV